MYVSKPDTEGGSPPAELGTDRTVSLAGGGSKRVRLCVEPQQLSYWGTGSDGFRVREGEFGIPVGPSSRALPLRSAHRVTE